MSRKVHEIVWELGSAPNHPLHQSASRDVAQGGNHAEGGQAELFACDMCLQDLVHLIAFNAVVVGEQILDSRLFDCFLRNHLSHSHLFSHLFCFATHIARLI